MNQSLHVQDLGVEYQHQGENLVALSGVNLELAAGVVHALVGESGCGKSTLPLAIMGLLPPTALISSGLVFWGDQQLIPSPTKIIKRLRGRHIAMIFQDPGASLNPYASIGQQLKETIRCQTHCSSAEAFSKARSSLDRVGLPRDTTFLNKFPHELSGGMQQRLAIAMAIPAKPELLLADEPTTALDTHIQGQILDLLMGLSAEMNMTVLLITHDLALAENRSEYCSVMYAGQIVESGPTHAMLNQPTHPYTQALLNSHPQKALGRRLSCLPGQAPKEKSKTSCRLAPRCAYAQDLCHQKLPPRHDEAGRNCLCHFPLIL